MTEGSISVQLRGAGRLAMILLGARRKLRPGRVHGGRGRRRTAAIGKKTLRKKPLVRKRSTKTVKHNAHSN